MDTTSDQLKECASISSEIEAATGVWVPSNEIWKAIYQPALALLRLGRSVRRAAFSIDVLRRAAQQVQHDPNFRDGSKNRPLKFKDIARRVKV